MQLSKYFLVAQYTWDEAFAYRLNFVVWRIRTVFQLLTIYFLWLSVLPPQTEIAGYNQSLMLTYVLAAHFIGAFIFSTRTAEIGENILNGDLSIFLIRPVNYFSYWLFKDIGDKAMNIFFSILELTILFFLLKPSLFIQKDPLFLGFFIAAVFVAILLFFFVNMLLGFIAFWSQETWAPRFIFMILLSFLAGGLFPLDILPKPLFQVVNALPFPYFLYFPLKIYLGTLPLDQILSGIGISLAWTIALYIVTKMVWQSGLRSYTAYGR